MVPLRAAAGRSPTFLPPILSGRAGRAIPLTPPPACDGQPPLIGAGLVGLQQQRAPRCAQPERPL